MKKYIGVKVVEAEPMLAEAAYKSGYRLTAEPETEGFEITYPDGYKSWCPRHVFERDYYQCDSLTFGLAVEALKLGKKVCRAGWNGKGMWLQYQTGRTLGIPLDGQEAGSMLPFIAMKVAGDSVKWGEGCIDLVPWLASQTDILATDWVVLD